MKSKFLFPAWCSILGYLMAIPGFILGYLNVKHQYEIPGFGFRMRQKDTLFQSAYENFTNELAIFLTIGGLLFIAFSKRKIEDELSAKSRLNALYWGVMIYYLIYIFGLVWSIFLDIPFVGDHASTLNLFAPLLIFAFRFYYLKLMRREQYLVKNPRFLPFTPYKWLGRILATVGLLVFFANLIKDAGEAWDGPVSNISFFTLIVGLMLWGFSKNKVDDEMAMQYRLESLQLAVYVNYSLLLISVLCIYSLSFLIVLVAAQFSLLLFFVLRMEYVNFRNNRLLDQNEGGFNYEK